MDKNKHSNVFLMTSCWSHFKVSYINFPISLYLVAIAIATTHFCWDLLVPWEFISQLTRTGIMVVKLFFCATVTKSIYNLLLLCIVWLYYYCKVYSVYSWCVVWQLEIIGASLSEPHTSVTALHTHVCIYACLLAWTDHLPKWAHSYISRWSTSWSMYM